MTKTKIGIGLVVLLLVGYVYYTFKKRREPQIEIIGKPHADKTAFKISVAGQIWEDTIYWGQIKTKQINGYSFEAISQASNNQGNSTASKKIVFSIKDNTQKAVLSKTVNVG